MKLNSIIKTIFCGVTLSLTFYINSAYAQTEQPTLAKYEVINHFKIGGDNGWDFLTMDNKRHQLLVTRGDNVQVVDVRSEKLLATLTGLHGSHGVAIADDIAYISNGETNSVTVIDLKTFKTIDEIAITGLGPDAIIYEPILKESTQ